MRTIAVDDLTRQPRGLIEDAQRGNPVIVSSGGEPLLLALPLGTHIAPQRLLLELAVTLFDREQISLGRASMIAGLTCSEMIDELGRREIAVIRLPPGELARELAALGE